MCAWAAFSPPKQVAASAGELITTEEGTPHDDRPPDVEAVSPLKKPRPQAYRGSGGQGEPVFDFDQNLELVWDEREGLNWPPGWAVSEQPWSPWGPPTSGMVLAIHSTLGH